MLYSSLFQCRLCAGPHAGSSPSFRFVTCVHFPISPAHTSGGRTNDCFTIADVDPSLASERLAPKRPSAEILPTSDQITPDFALPTSTAATPLRPSTSTVNNISCP